MLNPTAAPTEGRKLYLSYRPPRQKTARGDLLILLICISFLPRVCPSSRQGQCVRQLHHPFLHWGKNTIGARALYTGLRHSTIPWTNRCPGAFSRFFLHTSSFLLPPAIWIFLLPPAMPEMTSRSKRRSEGKAAWPKKREWQRECHWQSQEETRNNQKLEMGKTPHKITALRLVIMAWCHEMEVALHEEGHDFVGVSWKQKINFKGWQNGSCACPLPPPWFFLSLPI